MAVTVSLNIDYCASYLASAFLTGSDLDAAGSYGVYVAGIVITTGILVVPYWKMRLYIHERSKLALPAYIFAGCFAVQIVLNILTLIVAICFSNDFLGDSMDPKDNWFSNQVHKNNAWPVPTVGD